MCREFRNDDNVEKLTTVGGKLCRRRAHNNLILNLLTTIHVSTQTTTAFANIPALSNFVTHRQYPVLQFQSTQTYPFTYTLSPHKEWACISLKLYRQGPITLPIFVLPFVKLYLCSLVWGVCRIRAWDSRAGTRRWQFRLRSRRPVEVSPVACSLALCDSRGHRTSIRRDLYSYYTVKVEWRHNLYVVGRYWRTVCKGVR